MSKGLIRGLAASLKVVAHRRSQVPDFETRTPPEPGPLSKLRAYAVAAPRRFMASVVAAPRRVSAIAAGLLRSINRHRRAAGLVIFCVMVLSASIAGFVVYEPWPPHYSVAPFLEDPGTCPYDSGSQGACSNVFTEATSEKALRYITNDVASEDRTVAVDIHFYHSSDDRAFAEGFKGDKDSGVCIAYRGDSCYPW